MALGSSCAASTILQFVVWKGEKLSRLTYGSNSEKPPAVAAGSSVRQVTVVGAQRARAGDIPAIFIGTAARRGETAPPPGQRKWLALRNLMPPLAVVGPAPRG